jgi:diguanylate cyclase (GGDEF)-like protein
VINATRIRDAFRKKRFQQGADLDLQVTASLGVATYPEHALSSVDLVRAADFAMYAAKAKGRDDVCVAEPLADRTVSTLHRPARK